MHNFQNKTRTKFATNGQKIKKQNFKQNLRDVSECCIAQTLQFCSFVCPHNKPIRLMVNPSCNRLMVHSVYAEEWNVSHKQVVWYNQSNCNATQPRFDSNPLRCWLLTHTSKCARLTWGWIPAGNPWPTPFPAPKLITSETNICSAMTAQFITFSNIQHL